MDDLVRLDEVNLDDQGYDDDDDNIIDKISFFRHLPNDAKKMYFDYQEDEVFVKLNNKIDRLLLLTRFKDSKLTVLEKDEKNLLLNELKGYFEAVGELKRPKKQREFDYIQASRLLCASSRKWLMLHKIAYNEMIKLVMQNITGALYEAMVHILHQDICEAREYQDETIKNMDV